MDKEIILELINALKTLEDISRRRNYSMMSNFEVQYDINEMLIMYTNEIFSIIGRDLIKLMEKVLNQKDFEKYSGDLIKLINETTEKTKDTGAKIKQSTLESKLSNIDLQGRISEFNFLLDEINDSLE
jgi:predicted Ser/Thr protein kinase